MMLTKQPRVRDPKFLGALHKLPCITCGAWKGVEAAHIRMRSEKWEQKTGVRTGAGGAEKPADVWCLPLCCACHREGPFAEHRMGTLKFWRHHDLDPHAIAAALYEAHPDIARMTVVVANVMFGEYGGAK